MRRLCESCKQERKVHFNKENKKYLCYACKVKLRKNKKKIVEKKRA
ncbi:MAG: hypothetical protein KKG75_01305 [Nanoarchaeota archaeon]|nr:hypothetical protein [Nanoarchaeota archaeon]